VPKISTALAGLLLAAAVAVTGCGTAHHAPSGPATLTCRTAISAQFTTAQWIGTIAGDQARQNKASEENWVNLTGGQPTGDDGNDLQQLADYLAPGVHKDRWAQGGRYAVRGSSPLVVDAIVFSQDAENLIYTSEVMGGWVPQDLGIYRAIQADIFLLREDCPA
jgi:hypothetical protein